MNNIKNCKRLADICLEHTIIIHLKPNLIRLKWILHLKLFKFLLFLLWFSFTLFLLNSIYKLHKITRIFFLFFFLIFFHFFLLVSVLIIIIAKYGHEKQFFCVFIWFFLQFCASGYLPLGKRVFFTHYEEIWVLLTDHRRQ